MHEELTITPNTQSNFSMKDKVQSVRYALRRVEVRCCAALPEHHYLAISIVSGAGRKRRVVVNLRLVVGSSSLELTNVA